MDHVKFSGHPGTVSVRHPQVLPDLGQNPFPG
jgi:hypothetical protein